MTDPLLACFCRCSFFGSPLRHALQQRKPPPANHQPVLDRNARWLTAVAQVKIRLAAGLSLPLRSLARSLVPADLLRLAVFPRPGERWSPGSALLSTRISLQRRSMHTYRPTQGHHPREKGPSFFPTFCRSHSRFCCSCPGTHLLLTSLALPGITNPPRSPSQHISVSCHLISSLISTSTATRATAAHLAIPCSRCQA
ncbi:hypothetical protein M441DRAFT_264219 [Trichoderma asperellum CBS 433.97]|uniref:Uncharacterized protein n=1 Tax=Trichoderma asperellum (strain ATCC 204424 / CBS 433.97 / NBRC 101777) TaxID=1042311 RepID=A0A2T3YXH1_TRIA4|nr:hypothetical protein M441DRAFT_264219 [Trichoderma asperellum CBS 433.97]PTB37242.1 hypothetical protein M441DRAFT_264219 [Trichoderma asperellum CBS 433.97]